MKFITMLALVCTTFHFSARAEDAKGVDQAYEVCNSIPFSDDKETCLDHANKASYFQPSLVAVCAPLFPHDTKEKCINAIADKTANDVAIKGCKTKHFWDDIEKCLGKITKPYAAPAAAAPTAAEDKTCKKAKVSELINSAVAQCKKLQYLELYQSLVDLRAQLTLCGYE